MKTRKKPGPPSRGGNSPTFQVRIVPAAREILDAAAKIEGVSLAQFLLAPAIERAKRLTSRAAKA